MSYFATLNVASWLQRGRWGTVQCPGEACQAGFLGRDSAVLIIGGALDLAVAEDGGGTFQESITERHSLLRAEIPQPSGTDPSSRWCRLSSFPH